MAPEAFGGTLSIMWFIALFKFRTSGSTRLRVAYLTIIAILTGGIISCMFRSIWLGLTLGFVASVILGHDRGRRSARGLIALVCVGGPLALIAGLSGSLLGSDFVQRRLLNVMSVYSRFGAWSIAWKAFKDNPLFGVGYNFFQYYANHLDIRYAFDFRGVWAADRAHNMFLSVMAENGIAGVAPLVCLLIAVIGRVRRFGVSMERVVEKEWRAILVGICLAYVLPWFMSTIGYYKSVNGIFFLLLGVTERHKEWATGDRSERILAKGWETDRKNEQINFSPRIG